MVGPQAHVSRRTIVVLMSVLGVLLAATLVLRNPGIACTLTGGKWIEPGGSFAKPRCVGR